MAAWWKVQGSISVLLWVTEKWDKLVAIYLKYRFCVHVNEKLTDYSNGNKSKIFTYNYIQ